MVLASQYNGWWDQVNAIRTEFNVTNLNISPMPKGTLAMNTQLNNLITAIKNLDSITGSIWASPEAEKVKGELIKKPQSLIDRLNYLEDLCNHSTCCVGNCCVGHCGTSSPDPEPTNTGYNSPYSTETGGQYAGNSAGEKDSNFQPNECNPVV